MAWCICGSLKLVYWIKIRIIRMIKKKCYICTQMSVVSEMLQAFNGYVRRLFFFFGFVSYQNSEYFWNILHYFSLVDQNAKFRTFLKIFININWMKRRQLKMTACQKEFHQFFIAWNIKIIEEMDSCAIFLIFWYSDIFRLFWNVQVVADEIWWSIEAIGVFFCCLVCLKGCQTV